MSLSQAAVTNLSLNQFLAQLTERDLEIRWGPSSGNGTYALVYQAGRWKSYLINDLIPQFSNTAGNPLFFGLSVTQLTPNLSSLNVNVVNALQATTGKWVAGGESFSLNDAFGEQDVFTAAGQISPLIANIAGLFTFGIQVINNGFATWDIRLEGSLNAVNFTQILQHTTADGTAAKWTGANLFPCVYLQTRVAGLTGAGTDITVDIYGMRGT